MVFIYRSILGKYYCYIACAYAECDWLIPGHVALNKSNVSRRATSEKLLPSQKAK